eukprot:1156703-Pelagomonas_calceolata.AAC.4
MVANLTHSSTKLLLQTGHLCKPIIMHALSPSLPHRGQPGRGTGTGLVIAKQRHRYGSYHSQAGTGKALLIAKRRHRQLSCVRLLILRTNKWLSGQTCVIADKRWVVADAAQNIDNTRPPKFVGMLQCIVFYNHGQPSEELPGRSNQSSVQVSALWNPRLSHCGEWLPRSRLALTKQHREERLKLIHFGATQAALVLSHCLQFAQPEIPRYTGQSINGSSEDIPQGNSPKRNKEDTWHEVAPEVDALIGVMEDTCE